MHKPTSASVRSGACNTALGVAQPVLRNARTLDRDRLSTRLRD
jgi:hypothetical protein